MTLWQELKGTNILSRRIIFPFLQVPSIQPPRLGSLYDPFHLWSPLIFPEFSRPKTVPLPPCGWTFSQVLQHSLPDGREPVWCHQDLNVVHAIYWSYIYIYIDLIHLLDAWIHVFELFGVLERFGRFPSFGTIWTELGPGLPQKMARSLNQHHLPVPRCIGCHQMQGDLHQFLAHPKLWLRPCLTAQEKNNFKWTW